jgi:hypothetical protein
MPGEKTVQWYDKGVPRSETIETIMSAHAALVSEGLDLPTVREVLYKLLNLPGWSKDHYDTLCSFLEDCKERKLIEWGLFSPDGGGDGYTPLTSAEIARRIATLRDVVPARLSSDGCLHGIYVEHAGMTAQITGLMDYQIGVVSSQGQIRGEHLHHVLMQWVRAARELGAKSIEMTALVDYDKWGKVIFEAHKRWLDQEFGIELRMFGPTSDMIRAAGLAVHEDHQLDGWIAAYGVQRFKRELRRAVGLE